MLPCPPLSENFLHAMPKAELHCHLLGTVRRATFTDLARRANAPLTGEDIAAFYTRGEKPVGDGHVLADLNGPRFQVFTQDSAAELAGSPMHNPFGRLRLVSIRDIAETN